MLALRACIVAASVGVLTGCASKYHAWDGVKGYQDETLESGRVKVSYTAEKFTGWDRLDGYLNRRCMELAQSTTQHVVVEKVEHTYTYAVAQSEVSVGAPVRVGGGSMDTGIVAPTASHHDVLFKWKLASGICSAAAQ
ncbi:hypothetical protein [Alcanivorax sediminis]|uniref:Lipoprotein n=1 Tax=Alcanivorax sediminis TaxID=2663008 RepID=A0A6N7M0E2_9GAMM|nr:hypothetical protein [Alcanivorax sediminis]MQX54845.1 hypothetical protein [Alcanivorax sediminis]